MDETDPGATDLPLVHEVWLAIAFALTFGLFVFYVTGPDLAGFGEHYVPIRVEHSVTAASVPGAPVQNEFVSVQIVGIGEGENPVLEGAVALLQ